MNPTDQVRQKLAAAPLDFRLALLFAPAAMRGALGALWSVYLEIREIPQECRDPGVAETKLRWWEQEIDALCAGRPRHPLSQSLLPFQAALAKHQGVLIDLVAGTRTDMSGELPQSFEEVKRHCYRHSGALAELSAVLGGADLPEILLAARLMGNSYRLAHITTAGVQQALQGRVYFAAEDLRAHGIDRHINAANHSDASVRALLADYGRRSRETHAQAQASLPKGAAGALTAWSVLNGLSLARIAKLERSGFKPQDEPVELHPVSALFLAWRTAGRHSR